MDNHLGPEQKATKLAKIPVPKSMRTHKILPRMIAILFVVTSLAIFVIGAHAIQQQQRQESTTLDLLLNIGSTSWGALHTSSNTCIAYVQSMMQIRDNEQSHEQNLDLKLDSAIRLGYSGQAVLAQLSLNAVFSTYLNLESLKLNIVMGSSTLSLQSIDKKLTSLQVEVVSPLGEEKFNIPFPAPIYLIKRLENSYTIRFPPEIQQIIDLRSGDASQFENLFKVHFSPMSEQSLSECQNQVQDTDSGSANELLDVTPYLKLLKIQPNKEVLNLIKEKSKLPKLL